MNSASTSETKIFGLKIGIDPKIIIGGLLALAVVLFLLSNRADDQPANTSMAAASSAPAAANGALGVRKRVRGRRDRVAAANRDAFRIQTVDPSQGDINPTLRLDMLAKVQNTPAAAPGRSLFEIAAAPGPTDQQIQKLNPGRIMPRSITPASGPQAPVVAAEPPLEIPLKYYGYAKGISRTSKRRGLFLQGDNVVVASEGDLVDHKFLIVSLTPTQAQIEDTTQKRGKPVQVLPEAVNQ